MHNTNSLIFTFAGVNACCLLAVVAVNTTQQVNSKNLETARQQGLQTVAKHIKSDTCWTNQADIPFKLGDEITLRGAADSKIPTGCIKAPKTAQYLLVAYSGGVLKVNQVYSGTEVRNQLSNKGAK